MNLKNTRNLTMLIDFYELTMANGYLERKFEDTEVVFDLFFRKIPDDGGFAIYAGLEQVIEYIENLKFTNEDIEYLREKEIFSEQFLDYLLNFKFSCDVYSLKEGTVMFPNEPIITVKGPIIEAQLIETMMLLTVNHQSLLATKACRIVRASKGRVVYEFGARRAQSYDAAIFGARAAYIGGVNGTSCAIAERIYKIPAIGTMAHSWIQLFSDEYLAFKAYAEIYPDNCSLLVDTYNVVKSGVPNAIKVFNEVLKPMGKRPVGIRIDSGDIAYLSKKARQMLDAAGYSDVKIMASNSLDEYIIRDLIIQNAQVDIFGVGENLITSRSTPVLGGVYKLVAVEEDGELIPRIKVSETMEKITNPCFKRFFRFYSNETNKAIADYICCHDEDDNFPYEFEIFDPNAIWKRKNITNFYAKEMLLPIYKKGELVYKSPSLLEIRAYCAEQVDSLWDEVKRFENPHTFYVDLSQKLYDIKNSILKEHNH